MSAADVAAKALVRVLGRTHHDQRSNLAVIADEESGEVRLMRRDQLVAELRDDDLGDLADEAEARRVPLGALLVLFLRARGPRFLVVGAERRTPGKPRGRVRP